MSEHIGWLCIVGMCVTGVWTLLGSQCDKQRLWIGVAAFFVCEVGTCVCCLFEKQRIVQ